MTRLVAMDEDERWLNRAPQVAADEVIDAVRWVIEARLAMTAPDPRSVRPVVAKLRIG